jgi:hypothetical protein
MLLRKITLLYAYYMHIMYLVPILLSIKQMSTSIFHLCRYSSLAGDLFANLMLPGNAMNGSGWCIFVYNLAPETEENVF